MCVTVILRLSDYQWSMKSTILLCLKVSQMGRDLLYVPFSMEKHYRVKNSVWLVSERSACLLAMRRGGRRLEIASQPALRGYSPELESHDMRERASVWWRRWSEIVSYREVKKVPFLLFSSFAEKVPPSGEIDIFASFCLFIFFVGSVPHPFTQQGYIALATKAEREIARLLMRVKKKTIGGNMRGALKRR